MPASVEKNYADALFGVVAEKYGESSEKLTETLNELESVSVILDSVPEAVKLINAPAVSKDEKQVFLSNAFEGRVSEYTYNFLRVLADKGRLGYFGRIYRQYLNLHNKHFGITEITVTTAMPLDTELRKSIAVKMEKLTGMKVNLKEKTDRSLIGGIVIDYDGTRLDGSVKTRLEALKQDIAGTIA